MNTQLYLHSILSELVVFDVNATSKSEEHYARLLKKADELACGGFIKTAAGIGEVDSIFSHLQFNGKAGDKKTFPRKQLSLNSDFFPGETANEDLKRAFTDEITGLDAATFSNDYAYAETLLFLLHKYGVTLPSGVAPDISLYDFVKSKAAFAQCLAAFPDLENLPPEPFLLIGGDMSGIQEFLYDIVSTNASKNLKGRSYYLHLLGDTILTCLLQKLELPRANVVYASGGSFYVLAPNTDGVKDTLGAFEKTVHEKLFKAHKTLLSFIIGQVEFPEKVVLEKQIGSVWKALNTVFDQKKRAKFNQQLKSDFIQLFHPSERGGELRRDVITGAEILDTEKAVTYKLEDSFPKKVSDKEWEDREVDFIREETAEQIFMGLFLKSTMFRMSGSADFSLGLEDEIGKQREFQPGDFSIKQYILDTERAAFTLKTGQPLQTLAINDFDFLNIEKKAGIKSAGIKGFELYGGNDYPKIQLKNKRADFEYEAAKTFSELAGMEDDDRQGEYIDFNEVKFKRLGILRMDVDNLGKIFEEAYQNTGTLAHYSALSRQLDWFFKGYLNTLWKKGETSRQKWNEHTQIIYSGGDDLFIVGKWDCLIDFAEKIRNEFVRWTCRHEGIGISGGIVLVTPKFPVIKAAEMCGKAEKNAKKHNTASAKKNSISLFDYPLNWEQEWETVKALKTRFVDLAPDQIPKSLLMMLAAYHEQKKQQVKNNESPTWRWQVAYNLTRQKQRVRSNDAFKFIEELATSILVNSEPDKSRSASKYEFFDLVAVAIRWAEYELRHNTNDNNKQSKSESL